MTTIYHVARADQWEQATRDGAYRVSTLGRGLDEVGYLHASTAAQAPVVFAAFYRDVPDVVLLTIDTDRLTAEVRWELADGPDPFPHIYGPLNIDAVVAVTPVGDTLPI